MRASMRRRDLTFRRVDDGGAYVPQQPVHQFDAGEAEQYGPLVELVAQLDSLTFDTVLDVGCAEGFVPRLAQARYDASVMGVDIPAAAIRRMWDCHRVEGACADPHALPFPDSAFDVVVCARTLDITPEPKKVVEELARVARRHLFVGVRSAGATGQDPLNDHDERQPLMTRDAFRAVLPEGAVITYVNAAPAFLARPAGSGPLDTLWPATPRVKAGLALDNLWRRVAPGRARYMLARVDFVRLDDGEAVHRIPPVSFVTDNIYQRNETEPAAQPLHWGLDGTEEFQAGRAKTDEPGEHEPPLSDELVARLACPACHAPVVAAEDRARLECKGCGDRYEVRGGVPIMHNHYGGRPAGAEAEPDPRPEDAAETAPERGPTMEPEMEKDAVWIQDW
jgi:SAM-dependent methyltransferase